jgi:hypothetical protein
MKVCDLIDSMAFSHRPNDGISVGIAVIAGVAYMAVGFVRDGDSFNRKLARHILAQRIVSTIEGNGNVKFVGIVEHLPEKADARAIVREFRKAFKPDHTCSDATFANVGKLGNVVVRTPMSRDDQWKKIVGMFDEAVKAVNSQAVA